MLAFRRPCTGHRAALYAWVDRRERSAATAAALAHLDRCRACEEELSEVALAVHALGRLRTELEGVEPPQDAWPRLRARVRGRTDPWRFRASLGGLATSAMLVAVMVMPAQLGSVRTAHGGTALPSPDVELRREAAYLASIRAGSLPPRPRVAEPIGSTQPAASTHAAAWTQTAARSGGGVLPSYPPEMVEVRKEVPAQPATGRSAHAI